MKISNLRIERRGGWSYLTVDVNAAYTKAHTLWYAVPSEYEKWLTDDVYDAFLVSALYPAMYYNEPVEIKGSVSLELYSNLIEQVEDIVLAYRETMHRVAIFVDGFADARQDSKLVGTGFSAGVDSFCTFVNHFEREKIPSHKISALFFFNVGSHGGGGDHAHKVFESRYELLKGFPAAVRLPFVKLDSNLFDFYINNWEYDAGVLCRAAAILTLQRGFDRYYLSGAHSYSEMMSGAVDYEHYRTLDLASTADGFMSCLLSTAKIKIVLDGLQYLRSEKTELISGYSYVKQYLNVCVNHWNDEVAENCSVCSKCLRTLIAIESLGLLDQYRLVFDVEKYRKISWGYKCSLMVAYGKDPYATDNIDFARSHGVRLPTLWSARIYLTAKSVYGKARRLLGRVRRCAGV